MLDVKKCVKTCVEKYGLDEKEALRIVTTDNIFLSIEELRYKYDDLKIGTEYPEWITPEEHLKMCYATVSRKYYGGIKMSKNFYSDEDVVMDLFLYSALHIHSYKNKYHLNGLLLCKMRNLLRDRMKEFSCYYETYNWEDESLENCSGIDTSNNYNKAFKYGSVSKYNTDITDLILTVNSINNKRVKGILLICGYFLANIKEFLEPLSDYYNSCSEKVQNKIYDLGRDDLYFCEAINKNYNDNNKKNITIGRILKIFGKRDKSYLITDLLPYLKSIGFINI